MEHKETENNNVVIILNNSTYAHEFQKENLIHQHEFEQVINIINTQLRIIKEEEDKQSNKKFKRMHNAIAIFGERGTGKTSFLQTVLNYCNNYMNDEIKTIGLIDPTLLEEKAHVFVLILSLINEEIEKVLNKKECSILDNNYENYALWEEKLRKLAKAIPSLDKIGKGYNEDNWQDAEYIMNKGLKDMNASYHLEDNFHKMIDFALKILNKKAFLIAFDDIDINFEKGWRVLETIRKYLTSPKLIVLMCGSLPLYNLNVRLQQWKQIGNKNQLPEEEATNYNSIAYQLENQYMLKVFKTQNRIHLNTLNYNEKWNNITYKIKWCHENNETDLNEVYKKILNEIGIEGEASIRIFENYFKRMSVRSQINHLMSNWHPEDKLKDKFHLKRLEAFLSRMYGNQIDIDLMLNNPNKITIGILKYLTKVNNLRDSYQLFPTTENETVNACLSGLTILFAWSVKDNPFLIFDYILRIGYLRNITQAESDEKMIAQLIAYGSFREDISFKNIIGLAMACQIYLDQSLIEHVKISKKSFDIIQNNKEQNKKFLINLPLCSLRKVSNRQGVYYYSIFLLFAVIAQMLKRINNILEEESAIKEIKKLILDLQLLRNYFVPKDNDEYDENQNKDHETQDPIQNDIDSDSFDDNNLDNLAKDLYEWKKSYTTNSKTLPPYLLGRIATRFYFMSQKINTESHKNLGELMNQSVTAFLNTCLVIEGQEYLKINKTNQSNRETKSGIFYKNLEEINKVDTNNEMSLTIWLIKCPLLQVFIDINEDNNKELEKYLTPNLKDYNIYSTLKEVSLDDKIQQSETTSETSSKKDKTNNSENNNEQQNSNNNSKQQQ